MSNEPENKHVWQKPYNMRENLEGSVQCLDVTLNTLQSTILTLGSTIDSFSGPCELIKYKRHSELLLESDVEHARQFITPSLIPEMEKRLSEIRLYILKQENEEKDLSLQLKKQKATLEDLNNELEREEKRATEPKTISSTHGSLASQSEELEREIKKLTETIRERDQLCFREEMEVEEIQREIDEKQTKGSKMHENRHRIELENELTRLENTLNAKKTAYEEKERSAGLTEQSNVVNVGSISQYQHQLEYVQSIMNKLEHIKPTSSTIEDCKRECKVYLEALGAEKPSRSEPKGVEQNEIYIQQINKLCKALLHYGYAKTAARVLELISMNSNECIPIDTLKQEFPPITEKRHHLSDVVQLLIKANIIELNGNLLRLSKK
ncbi:hypothetical protein CU097_008303 [Rhizopus azygosporus]|uniref:Uncharacterized protein n=1 Tax=Rhizopus azygosporus TaxID=86630 RepID=A0A367JTT7_RHIAZ|nr:hypothetical protein CU097_008303 [Rhizopus azygosporus]